MHCFDPLCMYWKVQFYSMGKTCTHARTQARTHTCMHAHTYNCFTALLDFVQATHSTRVSQHQKGKTRKVKQICIYWSKRKWVAVASAGQYANLHLDPDI